MEDFIKWETEEYPRIWNLAFEAGTIARKLGKSRVCDLSGSPFITPSGSILKPYRSAWEQGWDLEDITPKRVFERIKFNDHHQE